MNAREHSPRRARRGAVAVLSVLALAGGACGEEPLVLRPDNTVIVDGSVKAGPWLQYYLLRCVAKSPAAETYAPRVVARPDRSASDAFPLYRAGKLARLPAGKRAIALGMTRHLSPADRARLEAHGGAVLLKRRCQAVIVAAGGPHRHDAELAAVGLFLDRCAGVRFYAPQPLWWSMPAEKAVTVGELDVLHKPAFAKTTWSGAWWKNYPRDWAAVNRSVSGGLALRASHTLATYFDPAEYYDKHPELYEMKAGRRPRPTGTAWNPCLSARHLPDVAMGEVRLRMKRRPRSWLSFGVMDCAFDCHCPACQACVRKHDGSYSNLYYTFLNEVARRCAKEFPDLRLTAYVYANVRRPPVGMRIEPNIVLDVVTKTYRWADPAWVRARKAYLRSWADLGASWIVHDWSFAGVSPREYTRPYAAFLQWGLANGLLGLYTEWSHEENWYLDGARYWIMRRLQSDPRQDVAALWKRYCDDMYGPGSEEMYRLFQHFADKYTYSQHYIDLDDMPRQEVAMYTAEDLAYQRELIRRARQRTRGDETVRRRFEQFLRYFRAHELFAQAVAVPARLDRAAPAEGVNEAALAFYVNDDGRQLAEAVEYYRTRRTRPPDDNQAGERMGALDSYVANYTRGLGRALTVIKAEALASVDLRRPGPASVEKAAAAARAALRRHLPAGHSQAGARRMETLLAKMLWVPAARDAPKIDGDLGEAAWAAAAELGDFLVRDLMLPSRHATRAKVLRVGETLYFAVRCDQVGGLWARTPKTVQTGTRIWRESSVEFFFGPARPRQGRPGLAQYIVNALGAWRGFQDAAGNRDGVEVAARLDQAAGRYVVEAALPLKAAGYDFTGEPALSFNIMRNVFLRDSFQAEQIIGWAPIFYTAMRPESRGLLFTRPAGPPGRSAGRKPGDPKATTGGTR